MTQDIAVVTIERQWEVLCTLSNGDISSDLDGPLTRFSFQDHGMFEVKCQILLLFCRFLLDHTDALSALYLILYSFEQH